MSHSEVAHRWFHQIGNRRTKENAYDSGNMFYEKNLIYSYGYHFLLGARFEDKVILNSDNYSNSTSKHKNHTWNAVDRDTHEIHYLPLQSFRNARYKIDTTKFSEYYKVIDYQYYIRDFEDNLKRLGNARKPEIYLGNIQSIQHRLNRIFETFRGSKTFARKIKGINKILNFTFDSDTQAKLKKQAKVRLEKQYQEQLNEWIIGERHSVPYQLNGTFIRVKDDMIQTSKGVRVPLDSGVRLMKLWNAGKALGVEIKDSHGTTWKCSKANGSIKFGCHVINKQHANKVLQNYL